MSASRQTPLYLDGVALLCAEGIAEPLTSAAVSSRGAYPCSAAHSPPRVLSAPSAASASGAVASVPLDYTLPLGPQVDLLQLLRGSSGGGGGSAPLTCVHLLPAPAAAASAVAAPPPRREAVLQGVKQATFCRYRHARDVAALTAVEEAALVEPCAERRADTASAMAKLFGNDAGGVPVRVLCSAAGGGGAGGGALLLRQAWLPLPASLSDALRACLRPDGGEGGPPLRGRACLGGCVVAVPDEADSWLLTAELAAALQLPDGFVYVALQLDSAV